MEAVLRCSHSQNSPTPFCYVHLAILEANQYFPRLRRRHRGCEEQDRSGQDCGCQVRGGGSLPQMFLDLSLEMRLDLSPVT